MKVRDLATLHVFTVTPETSVRHAAKVMLKRGIGGLPVLDDNMKLVGIITEGDLLRRFELGFGQIEESDSPDAKAANARDYVRRHSWKVGDVMTRNVITIDEEASVSTAARLLDEHAIKRLPVTSEGNLTGIISRSNLLRVVALSAPDRIAAGDQALRISIEAKLRQVLGARGDRINVTAVAGNVWLSGEVASPDECDAARVIVENIQGVKCIENHLSLVKQENRSA